MKTVYVAHPFRGDEKTNTLRVSKICRALRAKYPDDLFLSPIHAFSWFRDDHEGALEHCLRMLARCDELWLFGEWLGSAGSGGPPRGLRERAPTIFWTFPQRRRQTCRSNASRELG